ncbi:MAG TPA: MMPL family transporter [Planctomycetaceae bacterium]|nr:MMPL family transporter [Planctomycetaceae bacterium]
MNALHRRRAVTLALGLGLALVSLWGALRLSVNDSPERWMPASSVANWERFARHFEYGDTVVIGIEFRDGVRDADLEFLRAVRKDLERVPGIIRVTDVSLVAQQLEGVSLTELLHTPLPGEEDPYALYRGVLFDDPRVWNGDGTRTGRTLLTIVEIDAAANPALPVRERQEQLDARRRVAMEETYAVLGRHERPGVVFHPAGAVVIQHALEHIAKKLVVTLLPPSVLLMLLALGVGFRSLPAVSIALFGGAWAVCVMLGGVWLAGWSMNVVTVGGPTLMTVIVVATTVHFAHYHSEAQSFAAHGSGRESRVKSREPEPAAKLSDPPLDSRRSTLDSPRHRHFVHWVALPCLGAALTTGFGFLMLAFNELGPARELGFELFVGSVLAFFGAYLAWLWLAPFQAAPGRWLSARRLRQLEPLIGRRPRRTVGVIVAVLALAAWSSSLVRVDADPFSFFEKDSRVARALTHFSERKFGMYLLDVILIPQEHAPARNGRLPALRPPEAAQGEHAARARDRELARQFEAAIIRRPEVRHVISTAGTQERMLSFASQHREAWSKLTRANLMAWGARIVAAPTLADRAQVLEAAWADTVSNAADGLKFYLRYAAFRGAFKNWTVDHGGQGAMRVTFLVYDPGTGFRPLLNAVRHELDAMPAGRFDHFFTGTAANVAILSEQLVGSMANGLLAATAAMLVLCVVLFRSLRLTLIALLPNALPNLFVFGLMGATGIPLNSGSAMVATIALGVALNDTVHFIMHYRHRRAEGEGVETALRDTLGEIGRPIILTSVVMCLGFAIFLLSDFRPMYHFGLLGSIAMVAALVGDLVLLPNLLRLFDRDRVPASAGTEPADPRHGSILAEANRGA